GAPSCRERPMISVPGSGARRAMEGRLRGVGDASDGPMRAERTRGVSEPFGRRPLVGPKGHRMTRARAPAEERRARTTTHAPARAEAGTQMRITIVDSDNESFAEEEAVAARHGLELTRHHAVTEQETIIAARGADGILVQYAPLTAAVMDALPELKVIGRYGVGVDTVDVPAATARGIAVCNVPDYGVQDVSDHAIALTLSVVRGTAQLDRLVRAGEYGLVPVKPLHR